MHVVIVLVYPHHSLHGYTNAYFTNHRDRAMREVHSSVHFPPSHIHSLAPSQYGLHNVGKMRLLFSSLSATDGNGENCIWLCCKDEQANLNQQRSHWLRYVQLRRGDNGMRVCVYLVHRELNATAIAVPYTHIYGHKAHRERKLTNQKGD